MKFNISNMTVALAAAALGAASCTANYEDINRNPYEVTAEDMERDGYAMRSFMTTMQSWVIPADVNQCQFTDLLLGGPYGGYIADANSGFNTGKFSTYDPQSNWSPVFYRVIYTNEMSNFTELCKVTEDENAIAVAKVVKVAGVHRVADTYGPIPYTQVGTGADPVPLDSEKEVFKAMFAELDAAVEVLTRNRAGMITTDADRLYGGSLERWGRLANSLKRVLRCVSSIRISPPMTVVLRSSWRGGRQLGAGRDRGQLRQCHVYGLRQGRQSFLRLLLQL